MALVLGSAPAGADAGEWYGYQILATDVGGWALGVAGARFDATPVTVLGAGAILLGGPIVHVAHGNFARAGVSAGLRFGGTLVGAGLGLLVAESGSSSSNPFRGLAGILVGGAIGYLAGAITDIAVVAHEPEAEATPRMVMLGGSF